MSRLWGWVVAAFAALGAALLYVAGQRDRAREAAEVAQARAHNVETARIAEQAITQAKADAYIEAQEVEREQMEHQAAGTRPKWFGDGRMRDDKDSGDNA